MPVRRVGKRILATTFSLFLSCTALGLNPNSRITQYAHVVWRVRDSGLLSFPSAITQTSNGMIWVGTSDGLFSFDGVRFNRWTPPKGAALDEHENVEFLLGSRDGSLYMGTSSGLSRLKDGKLFHFAERLRNPGPFLEDAQGNVWLGGSAGNYSVDMSTLCKVADDHLSCLGPKDGFTCDHGTSLALDSSGAIWVGSRVGICESTVSAPTNYPLRSLSKQMVGSAEVHALVQDHEGRLWAGIPHTGAGYGLLSFAHGVWSSYESPAVDGKNLRVRSLLEDRQGSLWIGTVDQGLYRLVDGRLDHFDSSDGLSGNAVSQMFEDLEGNLWLVTPGGVDKFRDLDVLSFTSREGLSGDNAHAVVTTRDGSVWAGGVGAVDVIHGQDVRKLAGGQEIPMSLVAFMFRDSADRVWVNGGGQLGVYDKKGFHPIAMPNGKPIGYVGSMTEDQNHDIWVDEFDQRTRHTSLLHLHNLKVTEAFPSTEATDNQAFNDIAPHPGGGLWIGGLEHGLYWFHDGRFYPVSLGGYNGETDFLRPEADGTLWITTPKGILWLGNGRVQTLNARSGLPCETSSEMTRDDFGNMWVYAGCGLVRIESAEIERWLRDANYRIKSTVFDVLDGAEPRMGDTAPAKSPDGRIWFANTHAIQMIDPAHLPHNALLPTVVIEAVAADHKNYADTGQIRLPKLTHDIEIDYAALSYAVPQKVQFRYRLDGHDSGWIESGTRRQAFYNDLPPGHYTFHVIACNNDGVWNTAGTGLSFTIPPAWYQTGWFKLLCVIVMATFGYMFYRYRIGQHSAMLKVRFDERVEERTRLARDLHDTLLQTIQGSKMVADNARVRPPDPERMDKALGLVSEWLERATAEGRTALNSLRTSTVEINDLAAAFHHAAEDCRIGTSIEITHTLVGKSRDMHPIVRDEIYRIGYEALNNACLHSGGRAVSVLLQYGQDVLLRVVDDGTGIDPKILQSGRPGHHGLKGMQERAERIGAKLTMQTHPEKGTEVSLFVPGSVVFRTFTNTRASRLFRLFSVQRDHREEDHL